MVMVVEEEAWYSTVYRKVESMKEGRGAKRGETRQIYVMPNKMKSGVVCGAVTLLYCTVQS